MKTKYIVFLYLIVFASLSCKKKGEINEPVNNDPIVPAQVSNVTVVNGNGKATLTYSVPNDPHLLYVKAVYNATSGQQFETKASYYNNSLVVEGFADTSVHQVKLYSVSRSSVESAPIIVKIKPLVSPLWLTYKSLKIDNAFGGYNLTAVNPDRSDITIIVTKKNVFNEYEIDNNKSVYSRADSILSKIRGLDTTSQRYGFLVKDRWGNKTDTIYMTVKPFYETELPRTLFSEFNLPGDAPQWNNGETSVRGMWDGRLGWPGVSFTSQIPGGANPHMITFNSGGLSRISRIHIRPYPEYNSVTQLNRFYYLTTMKRFEIYGSANPSLSGALDNSWYLLGSYVINKPSGLPYGTDDATDIATASAGFNLDADLKAPKVRYIRIRCLENFGGGTAQSISEIGVYGDNR